MSRIILFSLVLLWIEPPDSILDLLKSTVPPKPVLEAEIHPPGSWLAEAIEQAGGQSGPITEVDGWYKIEALLAGRQVVAAYDPTKQTVRLSCLLAGPGDTVDASLAKLNSWNRQARGARLFMDQAANVVMRSDLKSADPSNVQRIDNFIRDFQTELRECAHDYPLPILNAEGRLAAPLQAQRDHALGKRLFLATRGDPRQRDRAVALLERAVVAAPNQDEFKIDLADAYVQLGHEVALAFATDYYEDVLQRHPQDPRLLARLSEAYQRLGNSKAALDFAAQRLDVSDDNGRYMAAFQYATVAMRTGQHHAAATKLQQVLEKHPAANGVRLLLATVLVEAGQPDEAVELIQQVEDHLEPQSPLRATARQMLERIQP